MEEEISLLLSPRTYNFKKSLLLHMHFGWTVVNQNTKTRIRALYILILIAIYSMLHGKSRIIAFFAERVKFQKKERFLQHFGW